jgi:hypothetical protein
VLIDEGEVGLVDLFVTTNHEFDLLVLITP